ncbi:MAG: transporter [Coriobacteriales bacterium]|jgi:drug/metabolite transporter (DMT)-like permease
MSSKVKSLFALHILLMVYSTSTIFSKMASGVPFPSLEFFLYYGAVLLLLAVYALGWQQILKRMKLTTAFSNKAVTVVWGIIWGVVFFAEPVTPLKVLGAAMIVAGVVLFSYADVESDKKAGKVEGSASPGTDSAGPPDADLPEGGER